MLPQLVQQCAGAKGCHGAAPTDSVALDLRESAAWDNLVGAASEVRLGAVRVQPFSPASSFLLTKLQGPLGPKEGKLMPLDPDSGAPISPSPAFDAFLHDVLERWIAQGARND